MPRYTRVYSQLNVVGRLWMPGVKAAQTITLEARDIEHIRGDKPFASITRDDVADWLTTHSGDFSEVIDFEARLSQGREDVDLPWEDEENGFTFTDCMYPAED
jgi:hypothetical protein